MLSIALDDLCYFCNNIKHIMYHDEGEIGLLLVE